MTKSSRFQYGVSLVGLVFFCCLCFAGVMLAMSSHANANERFTRLHQAVEIETATAGHASAATLDAQHEASRSSMTTLNLWVAMAALQVLLLVGIGAIGLVLMVSKDKAVGTK